jgi:glutamate formiminotransferase/glutamate formiminotransferase/formiminotetrahydrofolate cyclodeaminase
MEHTILLAVPNISEGRDRGAVSQIARSFSGLLLLDVHSDADHDRSVFTLAGRQGTIAEGVLAGARRALRDVDVMGADGSSGTARAPRGQHPHVGALDVAPVVYIDESARGAACAEALVLADRIGEELEVPVFLYGELTAGAGGSVRTRAELRRGGLAALSQRMSQLAPDFGPPRLHPTAGATLVAARPPLVAFNLQLAAPATLADARAVAARIREGGEDGLPGLRAIGIELSGGVAQVSMNVERPLELSLADVVAAVGRLAPVASAELVGLAPAAALAGFPEDVPMPGFDPARHIIENALGC